KPRRRLARGPVARLGVPAPGRAGRPGPVRLRPAAVRGPEGRGGRVRGPPDPELTAPSATMPVVALSDPGLVVLVGPAGSGKTTFAARHFAPNETLSSDAYRAIVGRDEA